MRSVVLGLGISLDGYIARPDGAVDFLFMPKDYSMAPFFASVDTAIMGRKTFDDARKMGGSFGGSAMASYVFSRSEPPGEREGAVFVKQSPAAFVARLVERIEDVPLPASTLLNVNVPAGEPGGVEVTSLGKRIYEDELKLEREEEHRRRYWIYGSDPGFHDEPGTDLAAVAAGRVAVTPIHFDLTDRAGLEALRGFDLEELLGPPIVDRPAPRAS